MAWSELGLKDYPLKCIAFSAATEKNLAMKPAETLTLSSSVSSDA
jgi:hypothetical protein